MKRNFVHTLLAMLVCVSLLLCMIACGENENKNSETGTQSSELQTQSPDGDQSGDTGTEDAGFSKNY